jgi:hypothetical protein
MNTDMPVMTASAYQMSSYNPMGAQQIILYAGIPQVNPYAQQNLNYQGQTFTTDGRILGMGQLGNLMGQNNRIAEFMKPNTSKLEPDMSKTNKLRVVRVFLVDPDERVPLEQRVLHRTDEMTTDSTDQELFFGIPVQQLLSTHNALRATIKWKDEGSKADAEPLKEIRIRDLVMSVTTIAEFQGRAA